MVLDASCVKLGENDASKRLFCAFLNRLLGIQSSPDWVRGPGSRWRIEFQSLPQGTAAALAIAAGAVAIVGVWWLYRREGRSLGLFQRLMLSGLRLGIVLTVTFMLLEMVLVISKRELIPSRLLVLLYTSQSIALAAKRASGRHRSQFSGPSSEDKRRKKGCTTDFPDEHRSL